MIGDWSRYGAVGSRVGLIIQRSSVRSRLAAHESVSGTLKVLVGLSRENALRKLFCSLQLFLTGLLVHSGKLGKLGKQSLRFRAAIYFYFGITVFLYQKISWFV